VSKPSAAEQAYMRVIGERMAEGDIRCCCIPKYVAVERHHPKGPTWETGTGLKAHDWFVIPLSKQAHDEYHADASAWEAKYGTHADLLKAFWASIGFAPGEFMTVGMNPKRAAWLRRVLERI
jgi:hypothetical protein